VSEAKYHRTIALDPPFEDSEVTIDTEPPMRIWIDVQAVLRLAQANPSVENLGACIAAIAPLVVAHNLVSMETGDPLDFTLESMSPGQIKGVLRAIGVVVFEQDEAKGGESADPLPRAARRARAARTRKRKSSPSPSSRVTPFPSTSPTTSSR